MQARISSREFAEWMAYYQLEPFGEERDDLRMARLATVISNTVYSVWTGKAGPYKEADMLLQFDGQAEERNPVDVAQKIANYFGGFAAAQMK